MSSLQERAMLASLHIKSWSGMMIDREVTDATNADFKAEKEAGRYNKRLVKASFFSGVSTAHSNARKVHRLLTLPWEDDGTRILSNVGYIDYTQRMKEAKRKVESEVKAFLENPDEYIREAKHRLGDMFKLDDYPSTDDLKAKFDFDVEINGMPEAKDFRAKLTEDQTKAVIKDIERRTEQRMKNAVNDVFGRIEEKVKHMAEKLRAYAPTKDGKKGDGSIHASLVYNINELAEILPMLNVTDDPRINDLAKTLKVELVEHSPEILRVDPKARQETLSAADRILRKVQGYMK